MLVSLENKNNKIWIGNEYGVLAERNYNALVTPKRNYLSVEFKLGRLRVKQTLPLKWLDTVALSTGFW